MADKRALSSMAVPFLSLSWLSLVVIFFFRNLNPVGLLSNQAPYIPLDLLASVIKIVDNGLYDCLVLAAGAVAALGAGWLALVPFRLEIDSGRRLTLAFALGVGLLSYLSFFVGLTAGYNGAGAAIELSLLGLFAAAGALLIARSVKGARFAARTGWLGTAFLACLCLVSLFLVSKALKPVVFYDSVTYHLGVPNYYIQEGGIKYIPYDSFSNFPFMAEMLYTLGLFLGGLKVAQLSGVLVFIASALAVREFSRAFVREVDPALPGLFFLLTPAFVESSILASCDLYLAYFTVMAVYCLFAWDEGGNKAYLALCGIFAGICLGTKNIAAVSLFIPVLGVVFYAALKRGRQGLRGTASPVLVFALTAVAAYLPWMVKNLVSTGNPFYPGFYGLFGGKDMEPGLYAAMAVNHPAFAEAAASLFWHPWALFMSKPSTAARIYRAAPYLGPVLLAFSPLVLLARGVPRAIKMLCALTAAIYFLWAVSFPLVRYLYPAIALLTIVAAYGVTKTAGAGPRVLKPFLVTCAAVFLVFDFALGFFQVDDWTKAYGFDHLRETDAQYLTRQAPIRKASLSSYPVYRYINDNLDREARVLIIGDAQHLYIERRHLYTYFSATTPYAVFRDTAGRFADVSEYLKREGITHIVYNPGEMRRLQKIGAISFGAEYNPLVEGFLKSGYVKELLVSRESGQPVYLFEVI